MHTEHMPFGSNMLSVYYYSLVSAIVKN